VAVEKLGVIADIHANALALAAVLDDARRRGVRRFVNLGDIVYGPLQPAATWRLLAEIEVLASVAGNQDRSVCEAGAAELARNRTLAWVVEELGSEPIAALRGLPAAAVVEEEVLLCHGTPRSDTTYLLEGVTTGRPAVRAEGEIVELLGAAVAPVVLCGHSHIPRVVRLASGQLVINPGSVGLPAYEDDAPVWHRMETYAPHASYAIVERGAWSWEVSLHRVSYDWDAAAGLARAAGREDWAVALATGRAG
jgi:predicted phosphodiesterase